MSSLLPILLLTTVIAATHENAQHYQPIRLLGPSKRKTYAPKSMERLQGVRTTFRSFVNKWTNSVTPFTMLQVAQNVYLGSMPVTQHDVEIMKRIHKISTVINLLPQSERLESTYQAFDNLMITELQLPVQPNTIPSDNYVNTALEFYQNAQTPVLIYASTEDDIRFTPVLTGNTLPYHLFVQENMVFNHGVMYDVTLTTQMIQTILAMDPSNLNSMEVLGFNAHAHVPFLQLSQRYLVMRNALSQARADNADGALRALERVEDAFTYVMNLRQYGNAP